LAGLFLVDLPIATFNMLEDKRKAGLSIPDTCHPTQP
jgi:hypothetical protein